jgi:hypothetical protein
MTANRLINRVTSATLAMLAGLGALAPALAGDVDLATAPLVSGLSRAVPPNVHFVLDDSRSMTWDYMPDEAEAKASSYCFKNFGFNKIYYNPSIIYVPPVKADSTSYPDAVFTDAEVDGFGVTSTEKRNLASVVDGTQVSLPSNPFTMTGKSCAGRQVPRPFFLPSKLGG